jgi:ADP-ribosylglycohydrolase
MTELINSKISGVLLGIVVGDQLGEQVENTANPGIIRKFRKNSKYTDDTEMTLITLQHLLSFETIDPLVLTIEYAANANFGRKYGGNAYKTLKKICSNPETWETAYTEFLQEGSWGNGCLMRISPIALFDLHAHEDLLKQHLSDCLKGTHNNEESLQCSIEYCLILKNLFSQKSVNINCSSFVNNIIKRNTNIRLTEMVTLIKNRIVDTESVNKYDLLSKFINDELVEQGIRSSDTLALIIATLTYNFKYKQWSPTQLLSIIISFGGDTDTNAAILGSLLGALYGIEWIDVDWFNNIENAKFILDLFKRFSEFLINKQKILISS